MSRTLNTPAPRHVPLDWLVLANAARARVFERDSGTGAMREVADAVHPDSREKVAALSRDRPGHAFKGQASTAFEPHTGPKVRERHEFAKELAHTLEAAAQAHRMAGLVLMASDPFLGDLKAALGPAAAAALKASLPVDLTSLQGADLEHHVSKALS